MTFDRLKLLTLLIIGPLFAGTALAECIHLEGKYQCKSIDDKMYFLEVTQEDSTYTMIQTQPDSPGPKVYTNIADGKLREDRNSSYGDRSEKKVTCKKNALIISKSFFEDSDLSKVLFVTYAFSDDGELIKKIFLGEEKDKLALKDELTCSHLVHPTPKIN